LVPLPGGGLSGCKRAATANESVGRRVLLRS
jgi:hypothetical protein